MQALSEQEKSKRLAEQLEQAKEVLRALQRTFEGRGRVPKRTMTAALLLVETLLEAEDE